MLVKRFFPTACSNNCRKQKSAPGDAHSYVPQHAFLDTVASDQYLAKERAIFHTPNGIWNLCVIIGTMSGQMVAIRTFSTSTGSHVVATVLVSLRRVPTVLAPVSPSHGLLVREPVLALCCQQKERACQPPSPR
ncbi:hypothetical protein MUK42_11123 [Musa troglodytarum]|uniref:Uncharacterized protein n=1 Tax=Musa troglodytarum TaxID=320322 RepID=A0A9E7GNT1_9LILI|nr:hypothetical protein MUK42_11123 [Musa troglodytarum]URE15478.1 hypothetical protein MUK42_11123 [Musa troglodytarum]URE15479.1 hypothetical protein MUK42_11123 [Musa troglodytarum]